MIFICFFYSGSFGRSGLPPKADPWRSDLLASAAGGWPRPCKRKPAVCYRTGAPGAHRPAAAAGLRKLQAEEHGQQWRRRLLGHEMGQGAQRGHNGSTSATDPGRAPASVLAETVSRTLLHALFGETVSRTSIEFAVWGKSHTGAQREHIGGTENTSGAPGTPREHRGGNIRGPQQSVRIRKFMTGTRQASRFVGKSRNFNLSI